MSTNCSYDAVLVLSFGGPEKPEDVIPFLENVLRGRNVPKERMLEVAEHYYHFGGKSPINDQNRALIAALQQELDAHGPPLPIYWGNRNWHPMLADTVRQMMQDGVRRAICFVTSAFSSYSGCRQYREDLARVQAEVGEGAPEFDKIRVFYNHPGYIAPVARNVRQALDELPEASLLFTAHSVPMYMADTSDYVKQLDEGCRLVAEAVGHSSYRLVYQSRSGPPTQPWLEPDILDTLREMHAQGVKDVVISPIGFISDHMEVLYDLDTEAKDLCAELGMRCVRAGTVGTAPEFISMIRELIVDRMSECPQRRAIGQYPANHDVCPVNCCPAPPQRPRPAAAQEVR